ncbi:MAG TPA: Smr/MutS family protein [Polyangia bacterium]|jgi:DNA-nicking Smr family endonuclease|nr:Smr/MutS family protein [Polyangia bacterium]
MNKKEPRAPDPGEEVRAFEQAMRDARKLTGPGRVRLAPAPVSPGATHKRGGAAAATTAAAAEPLPFSIEQEGERWTARANGIDRAFLKKLAAGKIPVEATLDLHGQTKKEALRVLDRFAAASGGARALLIVHGRGLHSGEEGPTLRDTVRDFLIRGSFAARVLVATSAPPPLGGAGATLVWLRRPG